MKQGLFCLTAFVLSLFTVFAQLPDLPDQPIMGARMPAISPDGQRIAFVYRGDIWVANRQGGRAKPITRHVDLDAYPLFSPDGKWISFSSTRNGNWDVFVTPAEGGAVKQLTFHSQPEIAYGWSSDGKSLIYSANYDSHNASLFRLDVASLRFERLMEDYVSLNFANFSPDNNTIVYGRYGFHWSRARYVGTGAMQVWLYDLKAKQRKQLTNNQRQHLWTRYLPDGKSLLTVTIGENTPQSPKMGERMPVFKDNAKRTPNLWVIDSNGRERQISQFVGGSVRFPAVASKTGDVIFEYEGTLYLMEIDSPANNWQARWKEPRKLAFQAAQDDSQSTRRREQLTTGVNEAEPSPDGKTFAFALRGDIWTVSIDRPEGVAGRNLEFARRMTDWVGADGDIWWSKDGKKIYFLSDRDFYNWLYEMDVETMNVKRLWDRKADVSGLQMSPDGKQLGFWVTGSDGGLYTLTLENNAINRVLAEPGTHWYGLGGGGFSWSPDMRWLCVQRRGMGGIWNLWILPSTGGDAVNITRLNASHSQPAWSPDGKYLFFQSDREGNGLYILPLTPEAFRPGDVDFKFEKPKVPQKADPPKEGEEKKEEGQDEKKEEKKEEPAFEVKIDFTDISQRIRRHSTQSPQGDLTIASDGKIFFLSEGDIWRVSYDGKDQSRLTTGGGHGSLRVSADARKLHFSRSGELYTMNLAANNRVDKVSFKADWERDVKEERKAAFTQFWRSYQRGFYDPGFHGRDWESIRQRYEPLLEGADTREEFAVVLQMMVSELEASHSEVSPAGGGASSPNIPHLGFTFDHSHTGPGIKVESVPKRAPGFYEKTRIHPGEYVLKINGQPVRADQNLFQWIANKGDRDFEFLVNSKPTEEGARIVKYRPISSGEWNNLNEENWVERLRDYVDKQSGGQIGYVYISGMGMGNQVRFEREFYEYAQGKKAMIIDVRFNGGGNIADTLIDWLERKPYAYYVPRDREPEVSPRGAIDVPMIVLMNERSMSNGEMFPYDMRVKGLAKLVGWQTPGYVIWTWGLGLVDGTGARMPQQGSFRKDGTNLENNGEKPDVAVWMTPEDWLSGKDPQLDKALEMLKGR
ncbi:MAG: PD40 domain-containing protein [Fimbriimonadia bacterium]|nr:PD40 domain-containing protein [Fimbriimonadia bacterium]